MVPINEELVATIAAVVEAVLHRRGIVPTESSAQLDQPDHAPRPEPLWDVDDVVTRLKLSGRSSVYELCRRRARDPLPALRCGKALKFSRPDVEAWISRQRVHAD